ncbi:ferulic acid esterase [Periconia macrospinosa]|uniref:Carboxylic ester hydrolase n=1 Tax=Periconia macrospinosa TaxID=97972 RepID=A0A2V1DDM7_9PLEO|nr:ferulic acid esterase [Periconia macrospinosa]
MRHRSSLALLFLLGAARSLPTPNDCAALASKIKLDFPFTVNFAQYVPSNTTIDPIAEGTNITCATGTPPAQPIPVAFCRVNLRVETSESSEIYMETWLPDNWKGRTLTAGNGGLAGCIPHADLANGASLGFASTGTNAGHNGTSAGAFYNQPEVVKDFAWRGVHTGTVVGKIVAKTYYGRDCGKSYYTGCSMGGRQGWEAVQNAPDLFDGVISGAPAINLYAHLSYFGYVLEPLGFNTSNISLDQWAAIQAAVLEQCDDLDGARDGMLEDPSACKFDFTELVCTNNSASTCLTAEQAKQAATLFAPLTYNGTLIHPGFPHGFEVSLISIMYSELIRTWLPEAFRYLIYSDISWDPTTFTLADALNAIQGNAGDLAAFDADISAFRDHGGKILHWHGLNDDFLSEEISTLYYTKVQTKLNSSVAELDEFYRYFRASGVAHCIGGPGAHLMGQWGQQVAGTDPDDNMLVRMVEWVEKGNAPEYVRGTNLEKRSARKHCKYPKVNHYKGTGDGSDEEGWECI